MRIVLNSAKVISHLYATLTFCLTWPSSMQGILAFFSILAVDFVAETNAPCLVDGFDYYSRLKISMAAPLNTKEGLTKTGYPTSEAN